MRSESNEAFAGAMSVDLDGEGRYLYRRLLGDEASAELLGHYRCAHRDLSELRDIGAAQRRTLNIIVSRQLDAAGIEPWLRGGASPHALAIKLHLLAYLGECVAAHPRFNRRTASLSGALVDLFLRTLTALFSLLRGYLQKTRHGLI